MNIRHKERVTEEVHPNKYSILFFVNNIAMPLEQEESPQLAEKLQARKERVITTRVTISPLSHRVYSHMLIIIALASDI